MKHILLSIVLVGLAIIASITLGVRDISLQDVMAAAQGHTETAGQAVAAARLPRTVLGIVAGAALATAGVAFQSITRNPLADPGIFGVLHGAALAVVLGITFGLHAPFLLAVLGAGLAGVFVFVIGSMGPGGATPLKLALSGAATAAVLVSLIRAVLLPQSQVMDQFRHWQVGDIAGAQWDTLAVAAPVMALALILLWSQAGGMNALALGDEAATSLGLSVPRVRILVGAAGIVLCGMATALCGPITFLGLIVPHVCRMLAGTNHHVLVPFAALMGAFVVLVSDTAGRMIIPNTEIAVGILMPLLGAPVFVWIVRTFKVRELA
ncbi:iron ABC transporter permease [Corynebacterium sp. 320]|uniref:FecCD family ABC transporter permease n=1 Tax=Corynebacterium TaxID=1716 RepID=UPI00125CB7D2|nr:MULTISPECIES: iron ABC transporter permease [Corynebacterium]KAB1503925.1 iron ABC transporter permease [Corynebacterium sp. 320]KAB1552976.1 iron ABC transporter permease [Corynebacterium sp. 321]KAB1553804.1 iron ABC transporter permease [Corynebacterium sp. 319]KAB3528061.1 iron ABC transporter permease [Corynebacterium sp. 250]KAB3540451.1 iron ABC transporter permease [Corynebacterium sp. 366]